MKTNLRAFILSVGLSFYNLLIWGLSKCVRVRRTDGKPITVLLTGAFYSDNWIRSQLEPMSKVENIKTIYMVSETPVPVIDKVVGCYPSKRLETLVGADIARLLTFVSVAFKVRPDVVGGFHLLLNGLLALGVGRLLGSKTLYICGGGIREVVGGGYRSENRIFGQLDAASRSVERQLLVSARFFDFIFVRGSSARRYFRENRVEDRALHIVTAGIDQNLFSVKSVDDSSSSKDYDLIFVGRISDVKRLHLVVEALGVLSEQGKGYRLAVVGDGPGKEGIQVLADQLGVSDRVDFIGWTDDVSGYLMRSRAFIMTSSSEGMSQAMLQAMMSGLPVLVTDVGDLADAVRPGVNGYLIQEVDATGAGVAKHIEILLVHDNVTEMGRQASAAKLVYSTEAVAKHIGEIFQRAS